MPKDLSDFYEVVRDIKDQAMATTRSLYSTKGVEQMQSRYEYYEGRVRHFTAEYIKKEDYQELLGWMWAVTDINSDALKDAMKDTRGVISICEGLEPEDHLKIIVENCLYHEVMRDVKFLFDN